MYFGDKLQTLGYHVLIKKKLQVYSFKLEDVNENRILIIYIQKIHETYFNIYVPQLATKKNLSSLLIFEMQRRDPNTFLP